MTVTDAIYDAGFGSSSRLYENSGARLGMRPREMRNGAHGLAIRYATAESPLGRMLVAATEKGVCTITFGEDDDELIEEGAETGRILMTSGGEYVEPVSPLPYPEVPDWPPHDQRTPPSYVPPAIASTSEGNGRFPPAGRNGRSDGEATPTLRHAIGVAGRAVSSFFLKDDDSS